MIRNLIVLPDGSQLFSGESGAAIMDCTLTRTVSGNEELTVGAVCSAMLEFTLIHPAAVRLTAGQEVTLFHVAADGSRYQVGVFCLEKPVRTGSDRCKVTAYDRVSKLDKDLNSWLKSRTENCALLEFARQVCSQCGLTLANETIPNGDLVVIPFSTGEVTGRQLMKWIGEAAGSFCRATPEGTLELAWYTPCAITLGPGASEEAQVWEEGGNVTVSSRSVKAVDDNLGSVALTSPVLSLTFDGNESAALSGIQQPLQIPWFQGSLELGDYRVAPVEAVQLQLSDSALWPEAAEGANAYILSGNPILSRADESVRKALQTVLDRLAGVGGYTPCRVSIPATGDILPGSMVTLTDTVGNTHTLPVMSMTRSGQKDTLECTGEARRDAPAVRNNKTIEQIAQQKVDALSQQDVFNKLTDNGKLQGLYIQDGKLYINAELVKIINLIADKLSSQKGNSLLNVSNAEINFSEDSKSTLSLVNWGTGGVIFAYEYDVSGSLDCAGTFSGRSVYFQGDGGSPGSQMGIGIGSDGKPWMSLPGGKSMKLSWKDNGDGTYTLIGT